MSFETGYSSTLSAKLIPADTTIDVATPPTATSGRMHIYKGTTHSWINYTGVSGNTLTGVTFVSQTTDPITVVAGNTFPAGTAIELVEMHDQIFDKQKGGTIYGDTTFATDVIMGTSMKVPVYADATARDVGIPSPANGMIIYNTALGIHEQYISGAWASFATGSVVNADSSTAGKVEIATTGEMTSGASVGGTGAPAVVTPQILQTYYNFGDGSDGDVTISVDSTISRDMYYANLTINTGKVLNPSGYAIYVSGTLTLNGTGKISRPGNNGTAGGNGGAGSGATAGQGGTALATGTCGVSLGGQNGGVCNNAAAGSVGSAGVAVGTSYSNITSAASGAGGNGLAGAGASAGNTAVATRGDLYNVLYDNGKLLSILSFPSRGFSLASTYGGTPSAGGGGGGTGAIVGGGYSGGGGGGSGGNGGNILVFANIIAGTGTIEAVGGNGGNGGNGNGGSATGGGGGGAGGCGGVIVLCYRTGTPYTFVLTGGTGGNGGSAGGAGTAGGNGATGTTGTSIVIQAT